MKNVNKVLANTLYLIYIYWSIYELLLQKWFQIVLPLFLILFYWNFNVFRKTLILSGSY